MSGQENLDLSKVIGVIMENPALIEQISNLTKQVSSESTQGVSTDMPEQTVEKVEQAEQKSTPTYSPNVTPRSNRAQLLGALKPYLSEERAKAIDSMISISEVLDMMRGK
jgi:hypothetical protein